MASVLVFNILIICGNDPNGNYKNCLHISRGFTQPAKTRADNYEHTFIVIPN